MRLPGTYISPAETGFYYLQSRYYDPEIGRFINADGYASTGQGIIGCNMFVYCRNSPVIRADASGIYDRDAAVEYAEEYYKNSNEEYYYYPRGDCANFVSQCLSAGGIGQNEQWYCKKTRKSWWFNPLAWCFKKYRYDWSVSQSWTMANEQFEYFSDQQNRYINGNMIELTSNSKIRVSDYNIQPGDLLFFSKNGKDITHAAILTNVDTNNIYYAGHTLPAYDKPLSSVIDNYASVFIIRICDDAS